MSNFNLDYNTLRKINPKLVMCSISGFGATGPHAHYVAVGSNIEGSGGLVAQTGYKDNDLTGTGTYIADPITGSLAALTISAALIDANASGQGRHIDMSLQESLTTFMVDNIFRYQIDGQANPPRANKSLTISPNGVYQCAGNDSWLALSVVTDDQWNAFTTIIGEPSWATKYHSFAERKANEALIDTAIAKWSARLDHNQATTILQSAGIPSGPVLANWEIVADPHLYYRDFWMEGIHPEVGYQRWEGAPWKFSATPATMDRSAPLFNEHADEILREFAGRTPEEIAKLRADGVVFNAPKNVVLFPV
jgi:crotonobetainyl-CoA:carnitine CoA-transferase CaiB-like acyl-CoA transferase